MRQNILFWDCYQTKEILVNILLVITKLTKVKFIRINKKKILPCKCFSFINNILHNSKHSLICY